MESIWLDLLNSDWRDHLGSGRRHDRLADPRWLKEFLARWDLPLRDVWNPDTGRALRELRAIMMRIVNACVADESPQEEDLAGLNTCLAAEPVVRRLVRQADGYALQAVPAASGVNGVLADIAASFAKVLAEGDPTRIKLCENADCKWVFYDRSRSRTRRWCEGATGCGNLIKVRRFRERRKKGTEA